MILPPTKEEQQRLTCKPQMMDKIKKTTVTSNLQSEKTKRVCS